MGTGRIKSGKVKKIAPTAVPADRYNFIQLSETEPDLGVPAATGYVLTSNTAGNRSWVAAASTLETSPITFVGDDSTGTAVNSGEIFKIAGGTGLTSAVVGDALTLDIDATVATLTGGQTLTNKTLTTPTISSPNITGHATIEGVTPAGATGTGNLVFSASPTVTGTLTAADISASGTLAAGNTTISGSLSSQDLTVTGSQSVSGNITVQGTVYSDKIKSPASNANLSLSAQGTGIVDVQSPITTVAQTVNGNITMPDGFIAGLGNIQIYSNTLTSTTNGNINIVANGTGQISLQSAVTSAYQVNAVSFRSSDTVDTNRVRSYSSNADIAVEPQGTGTVDFKLPTQSTVGSAGAASALPATPSGYIEFKINGSAYVMPYYAKS